MQQSQFVLTEYWNDVGHREDDGYAVLADLARLRANDGVLVRGIANYGEREDARVTFFAQGRAENCDDEGYYYTDTYQGIAANTDVSIWRSPPASC